MKDRHLARLAAFAILERDGKVLFARRCNTGYADGQYQMPSGHVEEGEYPVEAAARETHEEVGVVIDVKDLEFVHASYRINKDGVGDYVDFFFKTTVWIGEPINMEPDKCDELAWFSLDNLPSNVPPVIKEVIEHIQRGSQFSEIGRK
jgi:8-oxo-dGTP diphosphatase